ncbi:MAG: hypothetical protein AAB215_06385 [Planctomycetota bacterium]
MESRNRGRRRRRAGFSLAVALAALCGADAPPDAPLPAEVRGRVALSDGTALEGALLLAPGRRLSLEPEDAQKGKPLQFDLSDMRSIRFEVASESMERPWTFAAPGKDEKVYGEGTYPLREIRAKIRMKNGAERLGRLMTFALFVRDAKGEVRKLLVKSQQKGTVGQKLSDLVHPTAIEWLEGNESKVQGPRPKVEVSEADGQKKALEVEWDGPRILEVRLVGTNRLQVYDGKPAGKGFRADGLPDDDYDAALLTEEGIFLGLSASKAKDDFEIEGDPLLAPKEEPGAITADEKKAVEKKLALINDFFEGREIAAWAGGKEGLATGVRLTRKGKMSDGRGGKGETIAHDEIWRWHAAGADWVIDKRLSLFRREPKPGDKPPAWTVVPGLAGLASSGKRAAGVPAKATSAP